MNLSGNSGCRPWGELTWKTQSIAAFHSPNGIQGTYRCRPAHSICAKNDNGFAGGAHWNNEESKDSVRLRCSFPLGYW